MVIRPIAPIALAALAALTSFACSSDPDTTNGDGSSGGDDGGGHGSIDASADGHHSTGTPGDGGSAGDDDDDDASTGSPDAGPPPPGVSSAADLAKKLRGKPNYMIGLGNTNGQSDKLGVAIDLDYSYLNSGWISYNSDADGDAAYATVVAKDADSHGFTPVFIFYEMAANGEAAEPGVANDATFMTGYWSHLQKLYTRLGKFGKPSAVLIEPDFFGFTFLRSAHDGSAPAKISINADCKGLPDTVASIGRCFRMMRDKYAPLSVLGYDVSAWTGTNAELVAYYNALGANEADFLGFSPLDRDAGCYEAKVEADCQAGTGSYWDESNQTHPNFHDHFALVKAMTDGVGKPALWWQTPLGVPSTTPGGTKGHYRDNRVHYFFSHIDELVAAGGAGMMFGSGTYPPEEQTVVTTDNGQYKNAANAYLASPRALP